MNTLKLEEHKALKSESQRIYLMHRVPTQHFNGAVKPPHQHLLSLQEISASSDGFDITNQSSACG